MTEMREVLINGRWPLRLPEHRAAREEWATGWEPRRLESMYANLRPGDVVYDIGTEEGDLSALFAKWVSAEVWQQSADGGRMVATPSGLVSVDEWHDDVPRLIGHCGGIVLVEPNPRVWPNIRAIFDGNELPFPLLCWVGFASDQVVVPLESVATHWKDQWPDVAYGPVIGDHGFLNVKESPHLPTCTVDWLWSAEHGAIAPPTAITMDVEGAEILVARGMRRTLREHRPLVWVSLHAEAMFNDWGVYQVEFHSEFHQAGYEKAFLDFDHEAHFFYYPSERRHEVVLPCNCGRGS